MTTKYYIEGMPESALDKILSRLGLTRQARIDQEDEWLDGEDSILGITGCAGAWCYDCDVSLLVHPDQPHKGGGQYVNCPVCGQHRRRNKKWADAWPQLFSSWELDGNKRKGIMACYSFAFLKAPERIEQYPGEMLVRDEYGRELTMTELRNKVIAGAKYHIWKDEILRPRPIICANCEGGKSDAQLGIQKANHNGGHHLSSN